MWSTDADADVAAAAGNSVDDGGIDGGTWCCQYR